MDSIEESFNKFPYLIEGDFLPHYITGFSLTKNGKKITVETKHSFTHELQTYSHFVDELEYVSEDYASHRIAFIRKYGYVTYRLQRSDSLGDILYPNWLQIAEDALFLQKEIGLVPLTSEGKQWVQAIYGSHGISLLQ